MRIQNPHDKFFKDTMGKIELAKDFLNNYLPDNLIKIVDIDTLEPQKDSFIDKELKENFADMLFRVNINNKESFIYFLFEHKSYMSKNISIQLLKYMIEIWDSQLKNKEIEKLPMIIPIIIYHGKASWNIGYTLGNRIDGYNSLPHDIQKYIPNYKYLLYDLSNYTDEEIKGRAQIKIMMTMFRDIFAKDNRGLQESILRSIQYLVELEDRETGIEYFETLMRYIFSARADLTKQNAREIMKKIETDYPEGSEIIMSLAEKFREEGIKEGIKEGMTKGIKEGERRKSINYAIKLLTKRFGRLPEDYKKRIENADIEILDLIIEEIFSFEGLDDVKKYIY